MEVIKFGLLLAFFIHTALYNSYFISIYLVLTLIFIILEYYNRRDSIHCFKSKLFMSNWNSTGSPHVLFSDEFDLKPLMDLI